MTKTQTTHTKTSDIMLLMQFAEDQGFDIVELIAAVDRLRECLEKGLDDYAYINPCNNEQEKLGL